MYISTQFLVFAEFWSFLDILTIFLEILYFFLHYAFRQFAVKTIFAGGASAPCATSCNSSTSATTLQTVHAAVLAAVFWQFATVLAFRDLTFATVSRTLGQFTLATFSAFRHLACATLRC